MDEPTTGLHFADIEKLLEVLNRLADIEKLLEVLNRLADNKNSVLVIEHNLDVIKTGSATRQG